MPKEKASISHRLNNFCKDFKEENLCTDGKIFFCNFCSETVSASQRCQIMQHVKTKKHILNKNKSKQMAQQTFVSAFSSSSTSEYKSQFPKDLCKALIQSDIPLHKINLSPFRSFLEKYTKETIPDESTLRRKYLELIYLETLNKIRHEIQDGPIWISIDETTDVDGRHIGNVVIGKMLHDRPSRPFLLTCENLDKCNYQTIAMLFNDAMGVLWPEKIKYKNVYILITDAAPYMIKAAESLKALYPNLVHLTCFIHALHRIAETVRMNFEEVDEMISTVKRIFTKSPNRIAIFKDNTSIPLPPKPILSRWGTWLEAIEYYAINYDTIHKIVDMLDPNDAASIKLGQKIFKKPHLKTDIAYLHSNFHFIVTTIKSLEESNIDISVSLEIFTNAIEKLKNVSGNMESIIVSKIDDILRKNPGFKTMCKINSIMNGSHENLEFDFSPADIASFKYVPLTSCDVERSFSRYKSVLRDNRRSFLFDNLKKHFIIYCYGQ